MRIAEAHAEPRSSGARPVRGRASATPTVRQREQQRLDAAKAPLAAAVGLDAIPIRVDREGSVVVRAIVRPQPGCAIVDTSGAECGGMKGIDCLKRRRSEAKMRFEPGSGGTGRAALPIQRAILSR